MSVTGFHELSSKAKTLAVFSQQAMYPPNMISKVVEEFEKESVLTYNECFTPHQYLAVGNQVSRQAWSCTPLPIGEDM